MYIHVYCLIFLYPRVWQDYFNLHWEGNVGRKKMGRRGGGGVNAHLLCAKLATLITPWWVAVAICIPWTRSGQQALNVSDWLRMPQFFKKVKFNYTVREHPDSEVTPPPNHRASFRMTSPGPHGLAKYGKLGRKAIITWTIWLLDITTTASVPRLPEVTLMSSSTECFACRIDKLTAALASTRKDVKWLWRTRDRQRAYI